jgi:hypothetical protein
MRTSSSSATRAGRVSDVAPHIHAQRHSLTRSCRCRYPYLKGAFANVTMIANFDRSTPAPGKVNGGVWYFQRAAADGPVVALLADFVGRTLALVNDSSVPILRHERKRCPQFQDGAPAHRFLDDQWMLNTVLASAFLRREVYIDSCTKLDDVGRIGSDGNATTPGRLPRSTPMWEVPSTRYETPSELGTAHPFYPPRYRLREATLTSAAGVKERAVLAPPWLLSSESDTHAPREPPPPGQPRIGKHAAAAAAHWGANPSPAVMVHFVCFAWPDLGGRLATMESWGLWCAHAASVWSAVPPAPLPRLTPRSSLCRHAEDVWEQLSKYTQESRDSEPTLVGGDARLKALRQGRVGGPPAALDVRAWLRACGAVCATTECHARSYEVEPCGTWLHKTNWVESGLAKWLRMPQQRTISREVSAQPDAARGDALVAAVAAHVAARVGRAPRAAAATPEWPVLSAAVAAAAATDAAPLIAFKRPLRAGSRGEYQLWARLLFSAAMLTSRRPVAPLAHCANITDRGHEWSERDRCVYVIHSVAPTEEAFCVMRLPADCHGRVALPTELHKIGADATASVTLPRLGLPGGRVDAAAFARALGTDAATRGARLLLIDQGALRGIDDLSNLLLVPKGWLCTLTHKRCQHTCA